ncbi:MAG: glutathione S-transferase N-terminal domain-containing protein [Candidatus Aenigmarchaeota archaeon]|nr:glutathione S-transferase N-terminal domain-containing protein [Candidatus Aenigmarchaeota archaeon]
MKKVKIYTTPTCPYCEMAKTFFRENRIEYEEIDVSSDREAAMEMIEKSGQLGVPVIEIDDKIIVGFDVNAIKKALELE